MTATSQPCRRSRSAAVVITTAGAASASTNRIRADGTRRVDRHVRRAGLEHGQDRHDRLGRAGKQQRHMLTRAHALAGQQMRQPVGGLIKLAVGHRAALDADRHRLRGAGHLFGEQHRNRQPRRRPAESSSPGYPALPPGHAPTRRAHRSTTTTAPHRPSSPPTPAPIVRSAPRWCRGRTHRCETPPLRRSRRALRPRSKRSANENARSIRAVRVSTGSDVTCRSPRVSLTGSLFCQANTTCTSGMVGQVAGRIESLNKDFEGHVLVFVGGQAALGAPGPARSATVGSPATSTRSTKVLTKKPTNSSSAGSRRPAIGKPTATSELAADLGQQHRQAACTTMKLVALCSAATAATCCCSSAGHSTSRWRRADRPPAGRADRWATAAARAARPAPAPNWPAVNRCDCGYRPDLPAGHAATACNRRTAPATAPSRGPCPPHRLA